jgi:transposase-like protein
MAIDFLGKIRSVRTDFSKVERLTQMDTETCIKKLMVLVEYLKRLEKLEAQIKQEIDHYGLRLWYQHRPTEYAELLELRQEIVHDLKYVSAAIIKVNDDLIKEEKTIDAEQQYALKRLSSNKGP